MKLPPPKRNCWTPNFVDHNKNNINCRTPHKNMLDDPKNFFLLQKEKERKLDPSIRFSTFHDTIHIGQEVQCLQYAGFFLKLIKKNYMKILYYSFQFLSITLQEAAIKKLKVNFKTGITKKSSRQLNLPKNKIMKTRNVLISNVPLINDSVGEKTSYVSVELKGH